MTVFWGVVMAAASHWLLGDGHAWWLDLAYWMFVSVVTWGIVFGWQARRRSRGPDKGADTPRARPNQAD
jgi:type VI protein secretion system component VasK